MATPVGMKRKAEGPVLDERKTGDRDLLEVTPLGAGSEVGRSCHIIRFKGKTIMLDCGIHPAFNGINALPYFDEIEPSEIDLILISHFHLDHAAALPYFLEKTTFKGRVFMTHATKSIYKLILQDYVKVSTISIDEMLYDEQDLIRSMDKIEAIDYHQVVHHKGIKFWAYNAGHVLGAAMFMIEIAGVRLLYTGDYSRREDRHLMSAELPEVKPDILIVEATYGVQSLQPVKEREGRFCALVHQIIRRKGRCLLPVFALGRAQELLLILEEYWEANPSLHGVPIYYASALAKKCMTVYQTYINMMNKKIQLQAQTRNPFVFTHVHNMRGMDDFTDSGPCVVMASPGMLQNGLSRELFEMWCSDSRNGVIIPGYCVEGTLARKIMSEPTHVTTMSGAKVPLKASVHYVSFSAHADYSETSEFVDLLRPPHVILVHGDSLEMSRLRGALEQRYTDGAIQIATPRNCQTVELEFRAQKLAKTVGRLAIHPPLDGQMISGLIIKKDFNYMVLAPEDLPSYTPLASVTVEQRLTVPFHQTYDVLKHFVSQLYDITEQRPPAALPTATAPATGLPALTAAEGGPAESQVVLKREPAEGEGEGEGGSGDVEMKAAVAVKSDQERQKEEEARPRADLVEVEQATDGPKPITSDNVLYFWVHDAVRVSMARPRVADLSSSGGEPLAEVVKAKSEPRPGEPQPRQVVLEWSSNPVNDMIADSLIALITSIESHPGAAKAIGVLVGDDHHHHHGHGHSHGAEAEAGTGTEVKAKAMDGGSAGVASAEAGPSVEEQAAEVQWFLAQIYGVEGVQLDAEHPGRIRIDADGKPATVTLPDMRIDCEDPMLRARLEKTLSRIASALLPLPGTAPTQQWA